MGKRIKKICPQIRLYTYGEGSYHGIRVPRVGTENRENDFT